MFFCPSGQQQVFLGGIPENNFNINTGWNYIEEKKEMHLIRCWQTTLWLKCEIRRTILKGILGHTVPERNFGWIFVTTWTACHS